MSKTEEYLLKFIGALAVFVIFLEILFTFNVSLKEVKAQCVAGAPTNLTATPNSSTAVTLRWNPAASATKYALVFGLASGHFTMGALDIDGKSSMPMFTVTQLNPGTRYFFQVWAFCDINGPATPSNEARTITPIQSARHTHPSKTHALADP